MAGYSDAPLAKKLGIKEGFEVLVIGVPTEYRARWLATLRKKLSPEAAVWVSWPKKSSKVPTNITEDTIRELALPLEFVDVKVCAVTEVWSGLKLVVRKELRARS